MQKDKEKFKGNFKKIIPSFFVFLFLLFTGNNCFSQIEYNPKKIEIFVAPAIFNLELEKGETYNGKILLENKNDFLLPVKTKLVNFNAKDEFGGINYEKGEGANWFSLKRMDFALKPKERRIINFKIKVPKDVSRGGDYINWIFEPQLTVSDKTKTTVISRVSSLFLISVGKKAKANFKILETEIPSGARYSFLEKAFKKEIILNSASFPFDFRVKNNDIYHVRPKGTLEVFKGEKSIGKVFIKETTILPKKIRKISTSFKPSSRFTSSFYFGKHKIVLKLNASGVVEKREVEVFLFPLNGVIFLKILLISILLCFIIVKQKRRLKAKDKKGNLKNKYFKIDN